MADEIKTPVPMQGHLRESLQVEDDERESKLDWTAAIQHLILSRKPYVDNNANFAQCQAIIASTYAPLTQRYHTGERTRELFDAMMALPLEN